MFSVSTGDESRCVTSQLNYKPLQVQNITFGKNYHGPMEINKTTDVLRIYSCQYELACGCGPSLDGSTARMGKMNFTASFITRVCDNRCCFRLAQAIVYQHSIIPDRYVLDYGVFVTN